MKKDNKNIFQRILSRKKLLITLIIVIILGVFGYSRLISSRNKNGVDKTEIKKGTVTEELVLSGEINADEYAQLAYQTSGKIAWVGVKEGDWVKKGSSLGKLDTIYLNSAYQRARSDLRAAEATVENIHNQVKDHSGDETYVQKDTRTTAEVTKDKAYEAVIMAKDNLKNATLYAPFEGLVTTVTNPYSGVNITLGTTQFEIINPQTLYFDVSADQSEVINLNLGQKVDITLDSLADEKLGGEISFIGYTPKAGETGTTYKVKVKLDGANLDLKKFRIGMSGDAHFVIKQKDDVLYVPPKFITSDSKGKYLNLNSKNNKVYIEVGIEGEDRVEVSGDIKEGNTVYD